MTKRATFTEAQIRRAVAGAIKAGFAVAAVEIDPDGTIRLLPDPAPSAHDERKPEEW